MKVTIIGAGNMGGAIAQGLAQGTLINASDITVTNPSSEKLNALKTLIPNINVTNDNSEAVIDADIVIVAVKPWFVDQVLSIFNLNPEKQILVSVAAGIGFEQLSKSVGTDITMFQIIPNTAISERASMTLIASRNASAEQEQFMLDVFNELGLAMLIPEDKMDIATSLTSCGIAYVLKYIQAAMQAGVEMGIRPADGMKMIAQSVKGAAELILNNDTHPSAEIDKVTTPGGRTIKGINELDHAGFSSAIIRAMKASK